MNLGTVTFRKGDRELRAELDGAGEWQCEDADTAAFLEDKCSLSTYTDADGMFGVGHVLRAAKLLNGTPDFSETENAAALAGE
jgi:hypothetical protein